MDKRLMDVLDGKEANYLLPFLWQHEGNRARLRDQVRQVRESGCRAICVESRPHEHFGEDEWWGDMEEILDEAQRLDMKVWILDDKHFPTGYANGLIPKKYPERRKWQLIEHHVDLMGPMPEAALLIPALDEESVLLGVAAYPRSESGEVMDDRPVDLSAHMQGRFLFWDVPPGCWRVFFFIKTRKYTQPNEKDYIHLIDRESAHVLIDAVYEPHFEHFRRYFGNTIAGFFSDEPSMGNAFYRWGIAGPGFYNERIGMPGLALPWSDELFARMKRELGPDALLKFAALWYPVNGVTADVRFAYMDQLTLLYRDNFCRQIGDWCHDHDVSYIGHIIEDMNCHARLSHSCGHYFRSLDGQDMSGIDIVLHQILPGLGEYMTSAGGVSDPEFFHYVLAKLGSSMAHINPRTKGRAMCEVFGAYGWAEGAPMMKWLMDHLLVRGINHFVPHAFSPKFPDPDCPPHFGAAGRDPQFPAFTKLMGYVNRCAHLLTGGTHVANAAVLYHAEAEWMNGDDRMLTQAPCKALYDAHIDYDILPMDALCEDARVEAGKLRVQGETYDCLVVPRAPLLPARLVHAINGLQAAGLTVFYVDGAPVGVLAPEIVPLMELACALKQRGMTDVRVDADCPLLRIQHIRREGSDVFMLFNESVVDAARVNVQFPCTGVAEKLDLLDQRHESVQTGDGWVQVELEPYESVIYMFGGADGEAVEPEHQLARREPLPALRFDIELCEMLEYPNFKPYKKAALPFNLTGAQGMPDFTGIVRYTTEIVLSGELPAAIDLGAVGQTARFTVNDVDLGLRICNPYRFDVVGAVREGKNTLTIEVANTLVHEVKDHFSTFIQIPPSGLMGPVALLYE